MSKPKLDEQAMSAELGAVAGFAAKAPAPATQPRRLADAPADAPQARKGDTPPPRHRDTAASRDQSSTQAAAGPDRVETVRQAVRQLGKEAATYRFTQREKRALSQIVFAYKSNGIRTSENELTRIAINWLLEDHRANGRRSFLAGVLAKLNS
jgi:hypothetical protein